VNDEETQVVLVSTALLKPIEGHSAKRANWLQDKIKDEQIWTKPLVIDRTHHLVMDGHHRLEVAQRLRLEQVPCVLYGYDQVEVWSLRPTTQEVSAEIVIERALSGNIFPYKTAKHRFPDKVPSCAFPLADLNPGGLT